MRRLKSCDEEELMHEAKTLGAPFEIVQYVAKNGKLPVPNFAAGGIATPADASLMRQLGAEAIFVGSGIFKSEDPKKRAIAIVQACTFFDKPEVLADLCTGLGKAMPGLEIADIPKEQILQTRGW